MGWQANEIDYVETKGIEATPIEQHSILVNKWNKDGSSMKGDKMRKDC
jgi:hypothetical protein